MQKNVIMILGDSTSMTIGFEHKLYPFLMAKKECWPESTEFLNCSQPGFTSCDISAFFFRHRDARSLKAVIIYIGNCDSTASEVRKGKYTAFRWINHRAREILGITKERSQLRNALLQFEWNHRFDPRIEAPERLKDYRFNIARIVKICSDSSIPAILIRPRAHLNFPPGVGKGNFVFYHYLGIKENLVHDISIPDVRFANAARLREEGRSLEAMEAYREILLNSGPLSSHPEYSLLVANNYATCAAEDGKTDESEFVFNLLLKEPSARHEIILYNIGQVRKMLGDKDGYKQYLRESFECDYSMYRIKPSYAELIEEVASHFKEFARVIDMEMLIDDDLYIDHCHPLPEGQRRIADQVVAKLSEFGITGKHRAEIRNVLYNPEAALGNFTEFFTYFRTYAPYTEKEIEAFAAKLSKGLANGESRDSLNRLFSELPREIKTSLDYYLKHPAFPTVGDVLRFGPKYPSDVGRFPEYFLVRHITPYLRAHEAESTLRDRFLPDTNILRTSSDLLNILPAPVVPLVPGSLPPVDPDHDHLRLSLILSTVRQKLLLHLQKKNQIHNRLKTTIYWFFRETLRFGPHSRVSMRYERLFLEYTAEALAVAGVLDLGLEAGKSGEIQKMITWLEETVRIHELFCKQFSPDENSPILLDNYDRELARIANIVEASEVETKCTS
jgi:hypothetical protein